MSIRLILADDHPTFRNGLRSHLEREADLDVIAEASNGREAMDLVREHTPDVLVLDMEMPVASGLEVAETLAKEGGSTAILVLSAFEDETYIFGVLDAGAAGYLSKQEPLDMITEAIRGVARGDVGWLSRRISAFYVRQHRDDRAAASRRTEAERRLAPLSGREREVLMLVAEGLDNGTLASRLFISESTAKKHVHSLYEKLELQTRAQLVAWAWRSGVVTA
ncbi:MAG: response regulator transcription factor [Bacteroidota bacterium]